MKLVNVDSWVVALPSRRVHLWATSGLRGAVGQRYVVVRLHTDEGLIGWGEAAALPEWGGGHMRYYGETPETVRHIIQEVLFPAVCDEDPLAINRVHRRMDKAVKGHPYAKAAIDMALHDIKGRALNVPVYELLGGRYREWVPIGHSIGLMDVAPAVEEAKQVVAEGITTIKLKVGADPARDVEVVRQVRDAVGPEVRLRVDGNQGYTVPVAVETINRMERYGIWFAEQPVEDIEEMMEVARQVRTPLMADESVWTPQDVLRLRQARMIPFISLYVAKAGGLYRAWQVATVAQAAGLACDVGGSAEFGIGNAANLHLAAACPAVTVPCVIPNTTVGGQEQTEVAGRFYTDDLITEPFPYQDGMLRVPDGPGLGIEVDEDKLGRYREQEA
ncbi:MAG: mandelate racemase/muconate lactonizing enzyme family protein [Candidatus Bipolaricaulia bacterium]